MARTIISLDAEDRSWLAKRAHETGVSVAALIRQAAHRLRREEELLNRTRGLWRRGDGALSRT